MNENYSNMYNDEIEIKWVNLMFYLLWQWRTFLVALIIGAVAGGGIYLVKNVEQQISETEASGATYADYEVESDVRANMELAYEYHLLYDKQMEYNQNSLIMNMDPNQVYYGELRYYLAAGDNTRLIAELYNSILDDAELLNEIKEAGQLECDVQYVREILNCVSVRERGDSIEIMNTADGTENFPLGYHDAVIRFSIFYSDYEACEKMIQVICNKVEEVTKEYQQQYDDCSIELLTNVVRSIFSNDVLTTQKNSMDAINSYLIVIARLEKEFSEEDFAYYESEYLYRENESFGEMDIEKTQEYENVRVPFSAKSLIKWLVVGMMLVCACWGMYFCAKYLFDEHLKSTDELQDVYGLHILGRVAKINVEKGVLDKKLIELEKKINSPLDTPLYIKNMILSLNKKNILFVGNQGNESLEILLGMCAENPGFKWMGFVHQDEEALHTAKNADGEIIVAEIGKTISHEIRRELDVCKIQGIQVFGVIVIE